jgi:hypothetical protein
MGERKPVRLNLKRIGNPLDTINARLTKIVKTGDKTAYARKVSRELTGIRKKLSAICDNNRWFIDV